MGVLSVAVLYHLILEAIADEPDGGIYAIYSFMLMTLIGLTLRLFFGKNTNGRFALGFASIFAIGFHSFVDEIIYETSFQNGIDTGFIAAIGLMLYEFPEGVIAYFLVREARLNIPISIVTAFLASSLTTVLGAMLTVSFVTDLGSDWIDILFTTATGLLGCILVFYLGPHMVAAQGGRGYGGAAIDAIVTIGGELIRHSVIHF